MVVVRHQGDTTTLTSNYLASGLKHQHHSRMMLLTISPKMIAKFVLWKCMKSLDCPKNTQSLKCHAPIVLNVLNTWNDNFLWSYHFSGFSLRSWLCVLLEQSRNRADSVHLPLLLDLKRGGAYAASFIEVYLILIWWN